MVLKEITVIRRGNGDEQHHSQTSKLMLEWHE